MVAHPNPHLNPASLGTVPATGAHSHGKALKVATVVRMRNKFPSCSNNRQHFAPQKASPLWDSSLKCWAPPLYGRFVCAFTDLFSFLQPQVRTLPGLPPRDASPHLYVVWVSLFLNCFHVAMQSNFSIGWTFPVILKTSLLLDCSGSHCGIELVTANGHVCLKRYTQGRWSPSHFPSALPLVFFWQQLSYIYIHIFLSLAANLEDLWLHSKQVKELSTMSFIISHY